MIVRPLFAFVLLASCAPERPAETEDASRMAARSAPATPGPVARPTPVVAVAPVRPAKAPPRPAGPVLAVDSEGLRLFDRATGSARVLAFGQARDAVLAPLERLRGPAGTGTNADCGAGPVEYANWTDGLSLVFRNGRFAGWGLDGRVAGAITTAAGVGPGSTRAALEDAYDARIAPSSLGTEFTAGAMAGVLDGAGAGAKITDMWAGVACVAR